MIKKLLSFASLSGKGNRNLPFPQTESAALQDSMSWAEYHKYLVDKRDWALSNPTASPAKFEAACAVLAEQ